MERISSRVICSVTCRRRRGYAKIIRCAIIRAMMDEVLSQLSRRFDRMYARVGRPSIPPEKLLRAQLLQMLYSIRSERLLMEEMDYNLLFRWFVGLNAG